MPHELAGKKVKLKETSLGPAGTEYWVEDSMREVNPDTRTIGFVTGSIRMLQDGLQADMNDPELLYGKIGPFGYIVHSSEVQPTA
jgi:hypothetical protein